MSAVQASHLLIKYSGSRNPQSRRTGQPTSRITRDAAVSELQEWHKKITGGEISFADAARQRSDCSSFKTGGDLGPFGPGEMQKPFEDATYALAVGQVSGKLQPARAHAAVFCNVPPRARVAPHAPPLSNFPMRARTGIVETESGFHLIQRTA
jgi:peptidylprolyl isomerase